MNVFLAKSPNNICGLLILCLGIYFIAGCYDSPDLRSQPATNSLPVQATNQNIDRSESPMPANESPKKSFERIIKKEGWIKVDFKNGIYKQPRKPLEGNEGIFYSNFVPKTNTVLSLKCSISDSKFEFVERCKEYPFGNEYLIGEVISFDKSKRKFRYTVSGSRISTNGTDSTGAVSIFSFYDEDGDGVFEMFYLGESMGATIIPPWVK